MCGPRSTHKKPTAIARLRPAHDKRLREQHSGNETADVRRVRHTAFLRSTSK